MMDLCRDFPRLLARVVTRLRVRMPSRNTVMELKLRLMLK